MKRIYVSDLDGTLFSDFNGFDEASKARLKKLIHQHGVKFTFATARVVYSGLRALGNPPIDLPMIGCGGASMVRADGSVLHEIRVVPKIVREAVDLFQREKLGLTLILSPSEGYIHRHLWWAPKGFKLMDSFIASHWQDKSFIPLHSGEDVEGLPCIGMSCCGSMEAMDLVAAWAQKHPSLRFEVVEDPYQKGVYVGFVQDDSASKGMALEKLCDYLKVSLNQVTVFGDALNDLSMFALSCRKVAVDCAVPEIKALADIILKPGDTVLDFIERELMA